MTADTAALLALADRCEAARGPDREADCLIWCALTDEGRKDLKDLGQDGWRMIVRHSRALAYTASLDAAMTLVEPHLRVALVQQPVGSWAAAILRLEGDNADCPEVVAATPALALTAAALRARATLTGDPA